MERLFSLSSLFDTVGLSPPGQLGKWRGDDPARRTMFELGLPCATGHPHEGRQGYGACLIMHVDSSGKGAVLREPWEGAPKRAGAVPHAPARRTCDARHDKAHGAGGTP